MLANPQATRESAPFLPDRKGYGSVPEQSLTSPSLVVYGVVIDDQDTATLTRKARKALDADSYRSVPASKAVGNP